MKRKSNIISLQNYRDRLQLLQRKDGMDISQDVKDWLLSFLDKNGELYYDCKRTSKDVSNKGDEIGQAYCLVNNSNFDNN